MMKVAQEIGRKTCKGVPRNKAGAVASQIAEKYLVAAIKIGQANTIEAIFDEVANGSQALARLDYRSYGVIGVSCLKGEVGASINIGGTRVGSCGTRALTPSGPNTVSLVENKKVLCSATVSVEVGEEKTCQCKQGATLASSGALSCE
jgi:hypothetical protein